MIADQVAVHNERMKLLAGFINALGLAMIVVGALAQLVAPASRAVEGRSLGERLGGTMPGFLGSLPEWPLWLLIGLVMHGSAHYVVGYLKKATSS